MVEALHSKSNKWITLITEQSTRIVLTTAENSGQMETPLKKRLSPYNSLTTQIYGLPKIHKPNMPLRPIVCTIDSPTYQIAKFLFCIISPLTGNTDSFISNLSQFVDIIRDTKLDPGDLVVSFDVKSLFTNVPINDAVVILNDRLRWDILRQNLHGP